MSETGGGGAGGGADTTTSTDIPDDVLPSAAQEMGAGQSLTPKPQYVLNMNSDCPGQALV